MAAFINIFVAFFAIVITVQGASINNRIVGGQPAAPGQFKYIASLRQISTDRHFCGAVIISPKHLITCAQCRHPIEQIEVLVGVTKQDDPNGQRHRIESFPIHENYNEATGMNDIAVITLKTEITFNDVTQPIQLPKHRVVDKERLSAAGWGHTSYPDGASANDLQWMQMNVVSPEECHELTGYPVGGQICTLESKGHGMCRADSGSSLIHTIEGVDEVVGLGSSVFLCAQGKPDFFTDVYFFKYWILNHSD